MYQAANDRYEKMAYVRCGKSGLKLPAISLGLWHNFGDTGVYENMKEILFTAFDNGIVHFDLANNYGPAYGVVCSKRLLNQAVGKSLRTHNLKPKKGAQVMRKNEKITALYERLSRDDFGKDDDQQRESNSISNQKAMLEEFAARQGFTNIVHFTDDGISGTCFAGVR